MTSTTQSTPASIDGSDPKRTTPISGSNPPPRDLVGTEIGQYRIVRLIGQGGMGTVYEAVHTQIGQRAAVKVLHPGLASKGSYARRFVDEAKLVSKVGHPGLIKVFDFGKTADRELYILMEFLEGEELWDRIKPLHARGERLPLRDTLRITRQVASALAAVHAQSIIHRDLKPDNVFMVRDPDSPSGERAKILDFGIAKLTEGEGGGRMTTTGTALGTPAYMSPEQCEGSSKITDRADVYALGVMLFEMLSGGPPFKAASLGAVMRMHIVMPPPALPPSVPAEVRALTESMLAKAASERPPMTEVVSRLDEILEKGGSPRSSTAIPMLKPPDPSARPRWLVPAIGGVALALVGLLVWLVVRSPPRPDPTAARPQTGTTTPETGDKGQATKQDTPLVTKPETGPAGDGNKVDPSGTAGQGGKRPGTSVGAGAAADGTKVNKKKPIKGTKSQARWGDASGGK